MTIQEFKSSKDFNELNSNELQICVGLYGEERISIGPILIGMGELCGWCIRPVLLRIEKNKSRIVQKLKINKTI